NAGLVEEAQHPIRGLGTQAEPMADAILLELYAFRIPGKHRGPGADLLDEAAIARTARIGDDDVVIGALLRTRAGQTNFQGHAVFSCRDLCAVSIRTCDEVCILLSGRNRL